MLYPMNTGTRFLFFCFVVICSLSCNDKKSDPEKRDYIEAKINGALWSPSSVNCTLLIDTIYDFRVVNFSASSNGKTITIEAKDNATGTSINTGTRTYVAGSAYFGYNASGTAYHTISGSFNIETSETSSQEVTGTFDFTVEDNSGNQVHISNGKFEKVTYSIKTQ